MKCSECLDTDQTFTFVARDGSRPTFHINPDAMLRDIAAGKLEATLDSVRLEPEFLNHLITLHGVEPAHLDRLAERVASGDEQALLSPALIIKVDGYDVVIDGNHRIALIGLCGGQRFIAYFVAQGKWEPYVIEDMHPALSAWAESDVKQQWKENSDG